MTPRFHCMNRREIETDPLPGPSYVVSMSNPDSPEPVIKDDENVVDRLDLGFHDIDEPIPTLTPPKPSDAIRILQFYQEAVAKKSPHFVAQCDAGSGRSQAVVAALASLDGFDPSLILKNGTYNRLLYRLILEAGGKTVPPEPLVSIVVRVKYPADRLDAMLLSLQRQRHKTWEAICVTDGPRYDVRIPMMSGQRDGRVQYIPTREPKGLWGHPYRQLGIDAAKGEFIGLQNDDNYLTPGFIEQLAFALQQGADLALCQMSHAYNGWEGRASCVNGMPATADLGCWLARADLVRQVKWTGTDFFSDAEYVGAIANIAGKERIAVVPRVLFVKN